MAALMSVLSRAMMSAGVPAGAKIPFQANASKPGKPASATVCKSGLDAKRCGLVTPSNFRRPP